MTATSQVIASGPTAARIHATAPSGSPTYTGASAITAAAANTGGPGGVDASTSSPPAIVAPMSSALVASGPIVIDNAGGPAMATQPAAAEAATNRRGTSAPRGRASPGEFDARRSRRDRGQQQRGPRRQPPDGATHDHDQDDGAEDAGGGHSALISPWRRQEVT